MRKRYAGRCLLAAIVLSVGMSAPSGWRVVPPLCALAAQESVRVPVDTLFRLRLRQGLSSRTAQKGDTFTAEVIAPVVVGDVVAVPAGSLVTGRVTSVTRAARRRSGTIGVTFEELQLPSGQKYRIFGSLAKTPEGESRQVSEEGEVRGKSSIKRDVVFIGGGAGVGAVIGAAAGGGKGAGVGAAIGAGLGTAAALLRKGAEVEVPSGTEIGMVLDRELILTVRR